MKSSTTKSDRSKYWSKKRGKQSFVSKANCEKLKSIDFEASLLAQRQQHQNRREDASNTLAAEKVLPGYIYDSAADRYYRVPSSCPVQMANDGLKRPSTNMDKKPPNCRSIMSLLDRRLMSSARSIGLGRRSMQSEFNAASLLLKSVCFDWSDASGPDHLNCSDLSYHPLFGVARTSAQLITVYESQSQRRTSINLSSFTRLRGSSHPHWRPSTACSIVEKPTLAVLVHSDSFVQTMLLQQHSECSDLSRRSGSYPSTWKACKVGGLSSIDQGSVSKIEWSSSGDELFQLCETGIWMTNIERNFFPVHTEAVRGLYEMSYCKSSMVLSTRESNGNCNAVAICNSIHQESVKFVGFRNGDMKSIDIRCPAPSSKIGQLPYCVDHIDCLRDETTLVAQDITGQVSLYDCRMPVRRKFIEYMRVVEGRCTDVRKTRRFWIDPEEGFIVVPANSSFTDTANYSDKPEPATMAAYSLRCAPMRDREGMASGNIANLLSIYRLELPESLKSVDGSNESLTTIATTVKLPSSRCTTLASHSTSYESCGGLFCVANVQSARHGEKEGEGSALFMATNFDYKI